ncbi:MAG: dihydropteroate synthase, partial [Christensenellaceae bacterium]|nr:dihydropteroate synthase [Christensenellaceae bacterium]
MNFLEFLNNNIVLLDGAMGTMLQKNGMKAGDVPEHFNIEHSDIIIKIQKAYVEAGSNVIFTNTFGANSKKLSNSSYSLERIIKAAIANAKTAMGNKGFVAYDIGPIGELLQPSGLLGFDEAYELFAQQVKIAVAEGVDLFVIETMSDLQEVRAAVLAVKENSDLPLIASMSFEENGRTFTGCDVAAMACCLEGLGVNAIGINCSLGPVQLLPVVEKLLNYTNLPVSVKANAGLPTKYGGYDIDEVEFTRVYEKFLKMGVRIVGGCCGTTPEYISLLKQAIANAPKDIKMPDVIRGICSGEKFLPYGGIMVVGERLNPTGKPLFKEAILNEDIEYILKQALEQVEAGADILDLNLGLPKIDEPSIMKKVITALQGVSDIPLQIDSSKPLAIEAGLRCYCGKAIVNSVNGDDESLDAILPIVKKYGAAVIGLCLNKDGIPKNAEDRL